MSNLFKILNRTVVKVWVSESPLNENGYRAAELTLDDGTVLQFDADDDMQPYDPFFVVSISDREET